MSGVASVGANGTLQAGRNNAVQSDIGASGNTAFLNFSQNVKNETFKPGETKAATTEQDKVNITQEAEVPAADFETYELGGPIVVTQEFSQQVISITTNSDGSKEVFTSETEAYAEAAGDEDNKPTTNIYVAPTVPYIIDAPAPKAELPAPKAPEPKIEAPAPKAPEPKAEAPAPKAPEPKIEAPAPKAPEPKAEAPAPKAPEKPESDKPVSSGTIQIDIPPVIDALPEVEFIDSLPDVKPAIPANVPLIEDFQDFGPVAKPVEAPAPVAAPAPAPAPYVAPTPAPYVAPAPASAPYAFSFGSSNNGPSVATSSVTTSNAVQNITIGNTSTVTESGTSSITLGNSEAFNSSNFLESFVRSFLEKH